MTPRRRPPRAMSIALHWLPALLYVFLIFRVSSIQQLSPPLPFYWFDKVLHFGEYLGLGLLLARAWRATRPKFPAVTIALITLCCGILVATADEFYQSFVPGRSSSPWDLLADTVGLVAAQVILIAATKNAS